jgi:hypothetical protein
MKKKSNSQSKPADLSPARKLVSEGGTWRAGGPRLRGEDGYFTVRLLIASALCLGGILVALGASFNALDQTNGAKNGRATMSQDAPGTQQPDVIQLVGPVVLSKDLRDLPHIPQAGPPMEEKRLTRYQAKLGAQPPVQSATSSFTQSLMEEILRPAPNMPPPLLTLDGINKVESACNCLPADPNGDVGPNHYLHTVNGAFRVFDKSGNPLTPVITYFSFFAPLTGTPCANQNQSRGFDPVAFYDHVADRWMVSSIAGFPVFPGDSFWECIGVSQTGDPVAGGWFLYALQTDPAHPNQFGDYPKFAMWNNPQPGGAYHFTVNLFSSFTSFEGVRVFALDRGSMLSGGPANAVAFTVPLAGLGDSYSLQPASFRTGNPPPGGRDQFLLAVDGWVPGVTLNQVHGWLFHVDFVNPANSTLGLGPDHTPNAEITVDPFVQAWTASTYNLVPQQGTSQKLDTLGDKIMTPVVYQNRNGTESLWADQTVMLNYPNGPTAIAWYQFDVTGGNFPATPVQQQSWTNGNDGLWRWMPSIAVDQNGSMAIGYSVSSPNIFPEIRYAGRFPTDPLNDLGQGEAIMINGGGAQLHASGRWGDYSGNTIDPADGISFWHTNEYYPTTSTSIWYTRIGKFQFSAMTPSPTPTATATPTSTATPTVRPSPTARPRPTPAPRP